MELRFPISGAADEAEKCSSSQTAGAAEEKVLAAAVVRPWDGTEKRAVLDKQREQGTMRSEQWDGASPLGNLKPMVTTLSVCG